MILRGISHDFRIVVSNQLVDFPLREQQLISGRARFSSWRAAALWQDGGHLQTSCGGYCCTYGSVHTCGYPKRMVYNGESFEYG